MLQNLLHIVLWILTFLGITVLVLLGLLLLGLLLVLFVPLRYGGQFTKSPETMTLQVRVSWLLKLFRIRVFYEKKVIIQAFVLFFKVFDSDKPKRKKKKKVNSSVPAKKKKQKVTEEARTEKEKPEPPSDTEKVTETGKRPENPEVPQTEPEEAVRDEESKESLIHRLKRSFHKIRCQWKRICAKIKEILQNIRYYAELLKDDDTAVLFRKCKKRLFKVIKSILPRKLKAALTVGFGSPDMTGYLMAICGMLYPCLGKHVNIEPDFEKTILEGNISFRGHITGFVLLIQAMKLYFDKDLRNFIVKLKREES